MEIAALGLRVDADGVDRAAKSLENLSAQGEKAEKAVGGIEKTAAKVQKSLEGLGKSGVDAGQSVKKVGDDSSAAKAPVDALGASADKAAQAEARLAEQAERAGMSVGAMKAALRGVPAQFTDIAVSLQGGMSPLTVFLQQGGQLKDMFNGAGNAAQALGSYVIGLVNPFTVAAAAAAALGVAYYQGSKELDALRLAIVTTGNATGVSVTELRQLAAEMGAVSGSEAKASAALASFARAGVQGIDTLKDYAQAAVDWEKTTGTSVEKTAKAFASLQEDPLKAAMDLQKGMNFLTVATYEQAKAFEDQGKKSEAAAVLQRQYAKALNQGSSEIRDNLGTLERSWDKLGKTASAVWGLMLGAGRSSTLADQMGGLREEISNMERQLTERSGFSETGGGAATGRGARLNTKDVELLKERLRVRKEELSTLEKTAQQEKDAAEQLANRDRQLKALDEWNSRELKYLSDAEKLKRELNQERELGVRAGKSEKEILDRLAAIREEYAQKNKGAAREMNKEISEQAKVYAELAGLTSTYYTELARGQKQFEKGEITREQYVKFVETLIQKQPFVIAQKKEEAKVLQESLALAERERQQRLKVYASAEKNASSIQDGNKKLREEIELIGLSSEAQESILMQRERAILLVKQQHLAELERAEAVFGFMSREQIALMQEIEAMEERLALMGDKGIREKSARVGKQIEQDWEKVSQTISRTLSDYIMAGGTDAAVYLKRLFANLVLEPLVQIGVNSLLGMGAPAAGMASGGVNPLSVLSGGKTAMGIFGGGAGAGFMNGLGAWGSGGSVTGVLSNPGLYTGAELLGTVAPILLGGFALMKILSGDWFGSRGPNHVGAAYSTTGVGNDKAAEMLFNRAGGDWYDDLTKRNSPELGKQLGKTVDSLAELYKTLGKIGGMAVRDVDIVAGFASNPKYGDEDSYGYFKILDKLTGEVLKEFTARDGVLGTDPQKAWEKFVGEMGGALIDEIKKGDIPGWMREELDTLGDNVTVEGLNTVIQKIAVIDAAFKGWADTVIGFANLTAKAQTELLKFSNGIETLAGNVNAFYAGFYSEQERAAILQRQVMEQLKGLGVEIDPTAGKAAKDQFRKLIEEALASGNNELAAKLLALAQVFGVVADAAGKVLEGLAGERAQLEAELLRATGRTDEYNAALRRLATEGMSEAEKAAWDYNAALRAEIAARDQQRDLEQQWLQLNGDTAELRRRELATLDPSNRALQERIWALEDERTAAEAAAQAAQKVKDAAWANFEAAVSREKEYWQGVASSSQEAVQAITGILNPVKQAAKELFGSIEAAGQMQAVQGMLYIERTIAGLRGGSKLSSYDGLSDAITAARGGITSGRYASQFERDRDALVLANQLKQIAGYGDVQLSVEEKQLKNSQEQLQRLDKTLSYWRDLLNGNAAQIDATLSVERAIELLRAVLVPGSKPGSGAGGGTGSGAGGPDFGGTVPGDGSGGAPAASKHNQVRIYGGDVWYEPIIDKQLIDKLDRLSPIYHSFDGTGDVRGLLEAIKAAGGTLGDLSALSGFFESDWRKAASSVGIPAFDVGTNYVPRDMLAQIHQGEAIVPKAFNPWAGGSMGGDLGVEVRALRAELAQLREDQRAQASATLSLQRQTAKIIQRWDGDGLPHERQEQNA